MSTGKKVPEWESTLWSYVSNGDGQHCPAYQACHARTNGTWCPDENQHLIRRLINVDNFQVEKFANVITPNCGTTGVIGQMMVRLSDRFLAKHGAGHPPVPTELALLADEPNNIEIRPVSLKSYGGALWWLKDGWVIHINSNDSVPRQRFNLFHEVFHILAHRATPTPVFKKRGVDQGDFNELLADGFAMRVLTPEKWVKEAWQEVKDLDKMAEMLIAPKSIIWFRLKYLQLI